LRAIRSSITSFFEEKPPHTIQRLAELILEPTKHYKTLPAYLRAVDRVVSVTSSADIFPFNTSSPANDQSNGLVHPGNSSGVYLAPDYAHGLGSDESLGGALLTPIPWLNGSSFEGEDTNILDEGIYFHFPVTTFFFANLVLKAPKEFFQHSQQTSLNRRLLQLQNPRMWQLPPHPSHPTKSLMPVVQSCLESRIWVCKTAKV
jgi:hypothetical protein